MSTTQITPSRVWSPEQDAIFAFIEDETKSLIVQAGAGAGKTTTAVEAARRTPFDESVLFLAFNKRIQEELTNRLPARIRARTFHSLGNAAWKAKRGEWTKLDSYKMSNLYREKIDNENKDFRADLLKLVSLAKGQGLVPNSPSLEKLFPLLSDTDDAWRDIISEFDLEFGHARETYVLDSARKLLIESILRSDEVIDFDDQLYLPIVFRAPFSRFDTVFIDEAQDTNEIQREIVRRSLERGGRIVAIGDPNQCQPAGTRVRTANGYVPIESLVDGERVVTVDVSHSTFKASGEKIQVAKQHFVGKLIKIYSGGKASRYTPNHRTIVLSSGLKDNYAVYLMQKGNKFRIGSTKFGIARGFGPRHRMLEEKADKVWVLSIHPTKQDARLAEAILGNQFNISERTFISATAKRDGQGLNQPLLDLFWQYIEDSENSARNLLATFNKEYEFPIACKEDAFDFQIKRPSIVRACNLFVGMAVLHDEKEIHYKKHAWKPITTIRRELFSGDVYSLNVENTHTYVADGIATHNSIYGFRGAGTNSMEEMKEEFQAKELTLSTTYRCPISVVKVANEYVSWLRPYADAKEGKVSHAYRIDPKEFHAGDVVLCRNNAPLLRKAFELISAEVRCKVLGRDIGLGLVALVKKMKAENVPDLERRLQAHLQAEKTKYMREGKPGKIRSLADRVETIFVFTGRYPRVIITELQEKIAAMFADETTQDKVILSTIHKAKGLEWKRVYLLRFDLIDVEGDPQERNLAYVAVTRASEELIFLEGEI